MGNQHHFWLLTLSLCCKLGENVGFDDKENDLERFYLTDLEDLEEFKIFDHRKDMIEDFLFSLLNDRKKCPFPVEHANSLPIRRGRDRQIYKVVKSKGIHFWMKLKVNYE